MDHIHSLRITLPAHSFMCRCGLLDFVHFHSLSFMYPAYFFGFIALTPLTFVAFAIAHSTFHIHFTSFTLPAHSLRVGIPFNSMNSFHSIRLAHFTRSVPFHFIPSHLGVSFHSIPLHSIPFQLSRILALHLGGFIQ